MLLYMIHAVYNRKKRFPGVNAAFFCGRIVETTTLPPVEPFPKRLEIKVFFLYNGMENKRQRRWDIPTEAFTI